MENILESFKKIDQNIKDAKIREANFIFNKLEKIKIPRKHIIELCHLARRLNKPYKILKWLHPYVRPQKLIQTNATPTELSIYSIALTRIGAYKESYEILSQLDQNIPDVLMSLAQLNAYQWKYAKNIKILKKYLSKLNPNTYLYLTLQINLLASLVSGNQWNKVDELADKILKNEYNSLSNLLKANALEVLAQSLIHRKQYDEAIRTLEKAAQIFQETGSTYEVLIEKWKLIVSMLLNSKIDLDAINDLKSKAELNSDYETIRELDFYIALATKNYNLFTKVYHGTRFNSYKKRMIQLFNPNFNSNNIRNHYQFIFTKNLQPITHLDELNPSKLELSPLSMKMLMILFTDFYRPIQLGELFRELYPNEYFHHLTSKERLYKVFVILKNEINKLDLPIDILWSKNQVKWTIKRNFLLNLKIESDLDKRVAFLRKHLNHRFSIHDLSHALNKSKRTSERFLKELIDKKLIRKIKAGYFETK